MYCVFCGQQANFFWAYYPGSLIGSNYPVTVMDIQDELSSLDWIEEKIRNNDLTVACDKCIHDYYNTGGSGDDEWKATPQEWKERINRDRKTLQKRLMKIMSGGTKGGKLELRGLLEFALTNKQRGQGKP